MDDPFAALVQELNIQNGGEQKQTATNDITNLTQTTEKSNTKPKEIIKEVDKGVDKVILDNVVHEEPEQEQEEEAEVSEEASEEASEDAEEQEESDKEVTFIASIQDMTAIDELKHKFISFYKEKESEIYELKNKFTEISGRQKEVFIEVENRRKTAVAKGKKYKQTAQKLHYQINKLNNDLRFERKKIEKLNDEISIIRDQKKQREQAIETLTKDMTSLKSNLSQTEQNRTEILDEYQQTHSVIGKLIENEKTQEKLKCFIVVQTEHDHDDEQKEQSNTNLSILKLQFLDESIDRNSISIQWNRSYFTQFIAIKNANKESYKSSADDIGSIIKLEVRSKDNPDCFQSAILKNGRCKMHKVCAKTLEENLLKIHKQQIEFQIEPDLTEANTAKLLAHKKQEKHLILLFNKDKIKLRTIKNVTVDKEQYNDAMKITLSAINTNRFSLKLSATKKYVFNSSSSLERDNIAILLRSYIERLKRNTNPILCDFYLRITNERRNYEILNKSKGENTLTRDELVSKILAPISSNPRISPQSFTTGTTNSSGVNMVSLLTAPFTNPVNRNEPSLTNETNDEAVDIDIDEIFPDFTTNDNDPKSTKKPEIQFDDDEVDLETQNKHKKAWEKLQFIENATIASEQELAQNAIVPAPTSRSTKSKKKAKAKAKAKIKTKTKTVKTKKKKKKKDVNGIGIGIKLVVEITDRIDCLLSVDGVILKHQIVGNLIFKYDGDKVSDDKDRYFIGTVSNLENTKTKIFNPLTTEEMDKNGKIKVKLVKDKNEKNIGVLKYVWSTEEMEKHLPFLIKLNTEHTEDIYNVTCIIKPNGDWNGLIKEFCITGLLKDEVKECIENTEADDIQFVWSQSVSKKFMWSLKTDKIDKEYALNSKFKSSENNKVQLKIQFEIENIGISNIQIEADHTHQNNNAEIIKTIKNIRAGEFHVR